MIMPPDVIQLLPVGIRLVIYDACPRAQEELASDMDEGKSCPRL